MTTPASPANASGSSRRRFQINVATLPTDVRAGVEQVIHWRSDRFTLGAGTGLASSAATPLTFAKYDQPGLRVNIKHDSVIIEYQRTIDAFRALGRLLGQESPGSTAFTEQSRFIFTPVMIDVSRNGVLLPEAVKKYIRSLALLGINALTLYTEDSYEVPSEPFFGYLRGSYSHEELADLDAYAASFGIEMFPCIQTLGHLAQFLQWPANERFVDTEQILLAGEPETYDLIDRLIDAACRPHRIDREHRQVPMLAGPAAVDHGPAL